MEHSAEIIHLRYDRQNKQLISASSDKTARVWDLKTGEELVRVNHRGPVAYAGLVQASRRLASFADDGRLSIWETPGTDFDWRTRGGQALDICVDDNGQEITVAFPGYAYRLALADKSYTDRTPGYLQANDAAVSKDCRFAAYVDRNQRSAEFLRVFDLDAREEVWSLEPHSIENLTFSDDSRYLAVAHEDRSEAVYEVASGTAVKSWNKDQFDDVRVEFAQSGELLASIYNGSVTFRTTENFDIMRKLSTHRVFTTLPLNPRVSLPLWVPERVWYSSTLARSNRRHCRFKTPTSDRVRTGSSTSRLALTMICLQRPAARFEFGTHAQNAWC
jgi:WD40 repeat protein